ncbi:MAG: YgcG family protein [Cyclobacteriaceae bacterium]|nr:YgcG family protein [Cyclobacteriaceae bacterium]
MTKILILISISISPLWALAQDVQPLPSPAYVTDQTGTLSSQQKSSLTTKLENFEKEKGSQVVVVIVPTTEPEEIEQYGIRLAEKWKVGRKKIDDGIILIVAKDDRKLRIEVGYGLEGAIPDAYAKRIIENVIVPNFRQGQFYTGIDAGTDAIFTLIQGEELPHVTSEPDINVSSDLLSIVGFFGFFFIIAFVKALVKNNFIKGGVVGGLSLFTWWFSGVIFVGIGVAVFGLLLMFLPSGSGGGRSGGFGGYSGGSSFGGGFSGGGFSGGGGSFGGGGASGGW